jgi:hypothetical protein
MKVMSGIGANLGEIILHEHFMAESSVLGNAKTIHFGSIPLSLLFLLYILHGKHKNDVFDPVVIINQLVHVQTAL